MKRLLAIASIVPLAVLFIGCGQGGPRAGKFCNEKDATECISIEKKGETLVLSKLQGGKVVKTSSASECSRDDCHFVFDAKRADRSSIGKADTLKIGFFVDFVTIYHKNQRKSEVGIKWMPTP